MAVFHKGQESNNRLQPWSICDKKINLISLHKKKTLMSLSGPGIIRLVVGLRSYLRGSKVPDQTYAISQR